MFSTGMKASDLIKELERMIAEHGDKEVYSGGGDYPEPVEGVHLQEHSRNAYIPIGSFYLR